MEFLSSYLLPSGRVSPHSVSLSLLTYFMTSFTSWAFHRCGLCAVPALWWAGLYTSLAFLTEWTSFHVEFSWEKSLLHGNIGSDTCVCVCVCVCVYATINSPPAAVGQNFPINYFTSQTWRLQAITNYKTTQTCQKVPNAYTVRATRELGYHLI